MKKIILAVTIAALASGAQATGWGNSGDRTYNTNHNRAYGGDGGNAHAGAIAGAAAQANNRNSVHSSNRNINRNHQGQGQLQGQGQFQRNVIRDSGNSSSSSRSTSDQSQSLSNSNTASTGDQANSQVNGQNVTFNESEGIRYSGQYKIKSTPNVSLGTAAPTAPCYVTHGVSGSGVGFGFGINTATYDKECEVREVVRLGQSSGDATTRALADRVLQNRLSSYLEDDAEVARRDNPTSSRTIERVEIADNRDPVTGLPSF